ncbi:hypothetical protein OB13_12950 [Pontibacter sp. HJ8]
MKSVSRAIVYKSMMAIRAKAAGLDKLFCQRGCLHVSHQAKLEELDRVLAAPVVPGAISS